MPAHITVLFPLGPDVAGERVARVAAGEEPFEYRLARLEESPAALWLAPEPADRFVALTRAAMAEFPEWPPYGGAYADITPHLTIAMSAEPELRRQIEADLHYRIPATARATHLALYVSDGGEWSCRRRFAFG